VIDGLLQQKNAADAAGCEQHPRFNFHAARFARDLLTMIVAQQSDF
jgi:hypothetical protein